MVARGLTVLTNQQQEAVEYPENLLLTACPGSGKTRTLIAKLVKEIETVKGSPRRIACITYTNTAVDEIEQRADEQLGPGDEHYHTVSTIHAFCLTEILRPYGWMLGDYSRTATVLTPDNPDFETIARHAAAQVNYHQLSPKDFEAFESLNINANGQIIGMAAQNAAVTLAAPHFWQRCVQLNYIDFASIIYKSFCLLRDHPRIAQTLCSKYAWILVDEFQDTSELQIEILKSLYATGKSKFLAVGDLAQSIFGFAGARPELVEPFGQHIQAKTDLSLSANFRSGPLIVAHAELLFPRAPAMTSEGPDKDCAIAPVLVRNVSSFQAITEHFLPALELNGIDIGDATILAKDWASLINLSRALRDFGVPVVGPGARPYKRARLFASLAEQLCGAVVDPQPESMRQLQRALFHTIQQVTGLARPDIYSHQGRVILIRLLKVARRLAEDVGAVNWLDNMATATGEILVDGGYVDRTEAGLFYASVQDMKGDMQRQGIDMANLSVDDLGLFASPKRALRLSTIHYSKGREYKAVALIGLRQGTFPHFHAKTAADIEGEKRQFYVGVTRARQLLMYIAEADKFGNPPSPFLRANGVRMI